MWQLHNSSSPLQQLRWLIALTAILVVIIDGPCLSACTLVLSTIPHNRICVTRRAVLGFHAPQWYYPRTGQTMRASEATRLVTASYPPAVRTWIKGRGGLTQKIIYLRGKELAA